MHVFVKEVLQWVDGCTCLVAVQKSPCLWLWSSDLCCGGVNAAPAATMSPKCQNNNT